MAGHFAGIHKAPGSILTTEKRKRKNETLVKEVILWGHTYGLPEVIAGEAPRVFDDVNKNTDVCEFLSRLYFC